MDVELLDKRIEMLGAYFPEDHLEALKQERAELTGDATPDNDDSGPEVDVVEALSEYDGDVLGDKDAIDERVERLEQKLEMLGATLPQTRVDDVETEIDPMTGEYDAPEEAGDSADAEA